jgi:hypothetical protein
MRRDRAEGAIMRNLNRKTIEMDWKIKTEYKGNHKYMGKDMAKVNCCENYLFSIDVTIFLYPYCIRQSSRMLPGT